MPTYGQAYDEMIDECTEGCSLCSSYGASRILKEMDPTAYRCGFVDWSASLEEDCSECGTSLDAPDIDEDDAIEDRLCEECEAEEDAA